MAVSRFQIVHDASIPLDPSSGWRLHLHWGSWIVGPDHYEGYRFILTRPDGSLQPARGQARIPSQDHAKQLWVIANKEGWGNKHG